MKKKRADIPAVEGARTPGDEKWTKKLDPTTEQFWDAVSDKMCDVVQVSGLEAIGGTLWHAMEAQDLGLLDDEQVENLLHHLGFHDCMGGDYEDWGFDANFCLEGYRALRIAEKLGIDIWDKTAHYSRLKLVNRAEYERLKELNRRDREERMRASREAA